MRDSGENVSGYSLIERQLQAAGIPSDPSEVHGMLSGLLCAGAADAAVVWFSELFEAPEMGVSKLETCQRALFSLYERTQAELLGEQVGFTLLLPDDEQPLWVRGKAMVAWCQGFLYGLGLSGRAERDYPEEIREALKDLSEITRMDWGHMQPSEENEEAFVEVQEFVWVAVRLVNEVVAGHRREA